MKVEVDVVKEDAEDAAGEVVVATSTVRTLENEVLSLANSGLQEMAPNNEEEFPGLDDKFLCRTSCRNDPHTRTLPEGRVVKWRFECSEWRDHLRADHPALPAKQGNVSIEHGNVVVNIENQVGDLVGEHTGHMVMEEAADRTISGDMSGAFTQL